MKSKKTIAMMLVLVLAALLLTGCGSQSREQAEPSPASSQAQEGAQKAEAIPETSEKFTFWVYKTVDPSFLTDYNDNPALKYLLRKTYGPNNTRISFDFWVPPAGSANDNFSNMIGSGDYADIIDNVIGDTMLNSYNDGIALDITEYVNQYMPNYLAYLEAHPQFKDRAVTMIDGEPHYLGLIKFYNRPEDEYWGHLYRRDWIVKYGKNPVTGEAFTGGYTDENDVDSWEDNVIFPSGGSEPIYLSDWEWMLDIFQTALADLNVKDGYCYTLPYNGFLALGELTASFGGLCSGTFGRTLDNEIVFGPVTEQFRTYLQCMHDWYRKGWIDPVFNERTNDMFYAIDTASVYQGKVGLWFGLNSQVGRRMDNGSELLKGICAYPAQTPINDLYGSDEVKFKKIYSGYRNRADGAVLLVSTAARNKDLSALFSYFDSLYAGEGSVLISVGLNTEQIAELGSDPVIEKYDLSEGAYTLREGEDGEPIYVLTPRLQLDKDMRPILNASVMPGLVHVADVDFGYTGVYQTSMELWAANENIGYYESDTLMDFPTSDEIKKYNNIKNKISDYMNLHVPEFIMGKLDPYSEDEWNNWLKIMNKYGYQKGINIIQPYADAHPYAGYQAEEAGNK